MVQHLDAVADFHDQRHVVVDQEDARTVVVTHGTDNGREGRHLRFGEPGGRLVEKHEARLRRECAGDPEPPLVAVREDGCGDVGMGREAEQVEQLAGTAGRLLRRGACAERRYLDVLAHRQRAEGVAVLERAREAVPSAAARAPMRHVTVAEQHLASGRPVEAAEHVHECRLAGAVRADEAEHLATPELERDCAERLNTRERARNSGGPERISGPPLLHGCSRDQPA